MAKREAYTGIVKKGSKRAQVLGYPTINIWLKNPIVLGIYAARVTVEGKTYIAAAFADPSRGILEAHLIDFSGDLYGKEATIELHEKLRESKTFMNDTELKKTIENDIERARAYFKK